MGQKKKTWRERHNERLLKDNPNLSSFQPLRWKQKSKQRAVKQEVWGTYKQRDGVSITELMRQDAEKDR